MIIAELYQTVYLILVTIFSFAWLIKYSKRDGAAFKEAPNNQCGFSWLIVILLALFVGVRPISPIFADMTSYIGRLERFGGMPFYFDFDVENLLWDNMLMFFASIELPPTLYYIFIASIYFIGTFVSCKRLFPRDYLAAFLVWAAAFSTFAYGTNGLKAGTAASIFLLALSYREKTIVCLLLAMTSWGVHHSMFVPIAALCVTIIYRKPKYYFYFWIFSVIIAAAHITVFQNFFAGFSDEKGAEYLNPDENSNHLHLTGFRPDFIVYSAMPIFVGWYAIKKMEITSLMYDTILCMYLLCNGIWMLCMYANFTNRIAYLSWFMYPVVLIYPLLNEQWFGNRYKAFAKIAWLHLGFTLVMHFVYYT